MSTNLQPSSSTSKRKRHMANESESSSTDFLAAPGQPAVALSGDPSAGEDADISSAAGQDEPVHSAKKTGGNPSKRPRRNTSQDGSFRSDRGDDSDAASDNSAPPEENKPAGPPMTPPEQAGRLAPAGYKMNPPPTDRPVRVYADGVFDLFHLGHMRQLEQAKKAFPNTYLLVGIPNDTETHKRKGLTVLTDRERAETLRHCKWVDEVIENAPWIVTPEFLNEHNIDYVAHDDEPYVSEETDDIYRPCKEAGKFLVTQRTEGISTTYIITKIVRDYEKYIARQLKRGMTRQELNVSWLKKNEMDLKRHVNEIRETIKNNWSTTGRELRDEFRNYWSHTPRSTSPYIFGQGNGSSNGRDMLSPTQERSLQDPLSRPNSPHADFATGYTLGLFGGVRSWMQNRVNQSARASQAASEASSDDDADSPRRKSSVDLQKKSEQSKDARSPAVDVAVQGAA